MKITSFNVGLLDIFLFGKKIFEFSPLTRQRALKLPKVLEEFDTDILCLQEIYHVADIELLGSVLSEKFPYSIISRQNPCRFRLSPGLAIFSRFPIQLELDKCFKIQSFDEAIFSPKGFLLVKVYTENSKFFKLVNTHLSAGGTFFHPESFLSNFIREKQLGELVKLLATYESMLVGDLNCGREVSVDNFYHILASGFVDALQMMACSCSELPTWDPKNALNTASPHKTSPPQRIDHILLSSKLAQEYNCISYNRHFLDLIDLEDNLYTISDHYGVKVKLSLKELKA